MNKKVIAIIDVSTPSGREVLRDLQGREGVSFQYPQEERTEASVLREPEVEYAIPGSETTVYEALPEGKTYTHEEVWKRIEKQLNEHYGTNFQFEL